MSLMKWTLAMAGTAMTVRYLSNRHRQRLAGGSDRAPQIDRDDSGRSPMGSTLPGMGAGAMASGSAGSSGLTEPGSFDKDKDTDTDTLSTGGGFKGSSTERF